MALCELVKTTLQFTETAESITMLSLYVMSFLHSDVLHERMPYLTAMDLSASPMIGNSIVTLFSQ